MRTLEPHVADLFEFVVRKCDLFWWLFGFKHHYFRKKKILAAARVRRAIFKNLKTQIPSWKIFQGSIGFSLEDQAEFIIPNWCRFVPPDVIFESYSLSKCKEMSYR